MNELVSILMPVYNGEAYLSAAVQSVLDQNYPHWQLVVVDDGSTDGTADILAGFRDPRILYSHQANRGQAAALNRGLELCGGDYVTTLDADDALTPDSLRDRVQALSVRSDCGAVYADGYYCNAAIVPLVRFSEQIPSLPDGDVYPALVVGPIFGTGAAVMIRANVLRVHQLRYDETIAMCQDWDFYIRVAEHAHFAYLPTISVHYRLHADNMTATIKGERHLEAILRTRGKVLHSPRFAALEGRARREFWRFLLVHNLIGRPRDQDALLHLPQFQRLPASEQAALLRWIASEYLLWGVHPDELGRWLRSAWMLAPGHPKTAFVALLARLSPAQASGLLLAWRRSRQRRAATSPLGLALHPRS